MQIINAREEERNQLKKKIKYNEDAVDVEARYVFIAQKAITSIIKYANSYNYYKLRCRLTSNNLVKERYLRCNKIEDRNELSGAEK